MSRTRKASLVAVIVVALAGADAMTASALTTRGFIGDGSLFVGRQQTDAGKIRGFASLHGVEPGQGLVVVGSKRRCANADEPGGRVFRFNLQAEADSDDVFETGQVNPVAPLRTARSVIYYDADQLELGSEIGCARRRRPPRGGALAFGVSPENQAAVGASQRADSSQINVIGSVHGLEPGTNYALLGSTLPCDQTHDTNEPTVFRVNVKTDTDSDDIYGRRTVAALRPLSEVVSMRLFTVAGREQRWCDEMPLGG